MPRYGPLKLCKNRAGFESEPEEPVRIDLADLEGRAPSAGVEPLVNAGVILVLKHGAVEFSVFESGKMLFKTRRPEEALAAMEAAFGVLGWAWTAPEVVA